MTDADDAPPPDPDSPEAEVLGILNSMGYEGLDSDGRRNRAHAIARLMTTDWEELEIVEHAEHLLFPDVLIKRRLGGKWEETPVMLRVPREKDLRQSRVEARAWAAREKISEKDDRDLFTNMENMCVLARCIRNATMPFESMHPDPEYLERNFDKVCLQHMWSKLDKLNDVLNPAPNQLSSPEIVTLIVAIAKARHLGPLVVYGPGAQTSLVVSMADLLLNSVASKLSWESLELLMRESSQTTASASS